MVQTSVLKAILKSLLVLSVILSGSSISYGQKSALKWATYFGGDSLTTSTGIATDASGNVYITGKTLSSNIATKGAHKAKGDKINGDAFLAKFDSSGQLIWATYYGGKKEDVATAVTVDITGNVYVTGWTSSINGIATKGAYKTSLTDSNDVFIAKFSQKGKLLWATYYGGAGEDYNYSICVDKTFNIYISGTTTSISDIATSGNYLTSYSGGYDAFLTKFDSSGKICWGTYYGGFKDDEGRNVYADALGNIIISGSTNSPSQIATSGAHKTVVDSTNGDAFMAKFSASGKLLWSTYYGGNNFDFCTGIVSDKNFNLYFSGGTGSATGISTPGSYKPLVDSGNYEAFLSKFDSSGNLIWGTYFGGARNSVLGGFTTDINGIAIDKHDYIYITGSTGATQGIATSGSYKTSCTCGIWNGNAFITKFNSNGNMLWGTYYGVGTGIGDAAFSIGADPSDNIYIYGITNSLSGIATSGAYQTVNIKGENYFLAKFDIPTYSNDAGILSVVSPSDTICSGDNSIKGVLKNYGADTLKSATIHLKINGIQQNTYQWKGALVSGGTDTFQSGNYTLPPGRDTIVLWTSLPNGRSDSFPENDSFTAIYTVLPKPDAGFSVKKNVLTVAYTPKNLNFLSYHWHFGDGDTSTQVQPSHSFKANGIYLDSLTVTDSNGCTASFSRADTVINTTILTTDNQPPVIDIFPNPSGHIFHICLQHFGLAPQLSLYSITGNKIADIPTSDKHQITLNIADYHLSTGVYILKVQDSGHSMAVKLVVE